MRSVGISTVEVTLHDNYIDAAPGIGQRVGPLRLSSSKELPVTMKLSSFDTRAAHENETLSIARTSMVIYRLAFTDPCLDRFRCRDFD